MLGCHRGLPPPPPSICPQNRKDIIPSVVYRATKNRPAAMASTNRGIPAIIYIPTEKPGSSLTTQVAPTEKCTSRRRSLTTQATPTEKYTARRRSLTNVGIWQDTGSETRLQTDTRKSSNRWASSTSQDGSSSHCTSPPSMPRRRSEDSVQAFVSQEDLTTSNKVQG